MFNEKNDMLDYHPKKNDTDDKDVGNRDGKQKDKHGGKENWDRNKEDFQPEL